MNVESSKYVIARLEKKHNRSNFSCGIQSLDIYLKTQATQDMNKSVAVPYVITTIDSNDIIGYYTLSSMSIAATGMPEEAVRRLPRYPILPSILIGRLARNINQKGNRIGEFLLIDALKRSLEISTQLGSVAVVVDAISEKAVVFYRGYGFTQFKDNNRRLFLTMATIQELNL